MKLSTMFTLVVMMLTLVLFSGCAKAPTQELDDAKAALETAVKAEANVYAAEAYKAVSDSLEAAQAEIETQNSKFGLFRNYDRAKALLEGVKSASAEATQQAAVNKEKVRAEADTLIQQAVITIELAKKKLAKAPKGKEGKMVMMTFQNDLQTIESELNVAKQSQEQGQYMVARDKAKTVLDQTNNLITELQNAVAKKATITKKSAM
jgi:hypothetical protein